MQRDTLLEQLRKMGTPIKVIDAFAQVKREEFVPEQFILSAYDDITIPLPEENATLPQPSTIALMLQLLDVNPDSKVLEIGSGSGYVLALLAYLALQGEIYGVEMNTKLAAMSTKRLWQTKHIQVFNTDGSQGLSQKAPFNRIILSAAASDLSIVYQILDQLSEPGILVAPVKESLFQLKKENGQVIKAEFPGFKFVPLIKKEI